MKLWQAPLDGSSIHLAVEGSCGGTTLGVQLARQAISDGGRVLWAAPELPDGVRFSQIFTGIELTASSRFHAMNLVGNVDKALESLLHNAKMLPGVSLVVLDDYCPPNGKIPSDVVKAVNNLISQTDWTTLLISKGGESMDSTPLVARGKSKLNTDKIWLLTRPNADSKRILWIDEESIELCLVEEGFQS
ncbi:MAG: hypothetical protein L7S49_01045 [Candidatus Poseidoniaceae archaeon]|nr:hypothetical protein [Candidatus Poseidoniaceae archaeon]